MPETNSTTRPRKKTPKRGDSAARRKLAATIKGKYAWIPYSSEDFNRDKRREIALQYFM